ncbi:hypothetical protein BCR36DRAFT_585766 [Piromyces finnis]|uniref:Uncharacterized protein n=1 Tax=Piromyces finnis TaxID=1754191 RepID=A0A1Y1V1G3_9FUNG|nr:hypothetical protein BCR36DRAFT_585766 [Piromyces finnis]|eukprot:ORX45143.1 hypothetical protein BCR36DRAFT_585766 [Piromyces finnis]
MSKDIYTYFDLFPHEKNMQKFPARISSKVPVQIAMHSRNNSNGYEGHHSYKNEKICDYDMPLVKPIAINTLSKKSKDESNSYQSYFSLGQTPSNSSTSSNNTQKTFNNNNNSVIDYQFKFDEDDFPKIRKESFDNKMSLNSIEYNESVTFAVLNSDIYAKKSYRDFIDGSIEGNYDRDYKKLYNDKDIMDIKSIKNKENLKSLYTHESRNNNSKLKEEKVHKKLIGNEIIFNPDESPIIIPEKPTNNKVDMSKSILFKNSNSSTDSLSSSGSHSHSGKKRVSLKKTRNSINISRSRSNSLSKKSGHKNDFDDYSEFNLESYSSEVRSYSLPRRSVDCHTIDTRSRSNTLPRSLIISPAKDEKFLVYSSPKKDSYNVQDIPAVKTMEYEKKNNYNSYDDDKGSFIYNQSDLISPSICDVIEYRNFLKSKNYEMPDSKEERRHRSLSRKHESRYRSLSRSSDNNDKSEGKRRSRSKSKRKSKNEHTNLTVKNVDDESRYRSLSRSRKDSRDDERVEKIEKERAERMEKENKERERKRSTSRHKKCHRKNKSSSNHDSPLVKSSPIVRNNSHGSNVGSPFNKGSPLVRRDSRGSNIGSPLTRKEGYSSPLASNSLANNKFSTAFIQNDYSKSPLESKSPFESRNYQNIENVFQINKNDYPNVNISDEDEDNKNNYSSTTTVGKTQNKDIINEICDLKKFSQDFSSLNVLESILNRPIEDDFEFLNYKRISDVQKLDNHKFSTLTRLSSQSKRRSKSRELARRNSDIDFRKGHNRASSEQLRNEDGSNGKGNKRNIFNFFSHKKSKSYSSSSDKSLSNEKNKVLNFDKMIKGNETIKIKLQSSSKIGSPYIIPRSMDDNSSDSDINNEEYSTSYKNFLKEKMMNQQQQQQQFNKPPINNIKDYTPLFRINMINNNSMNPHFNNMEFYGATKEMPTNPYDQFNDFSMDEIEIDRKPVNHIKRNSSLSRNNKHGSKRIIY